MSPHTVDSHIRNAVKILGVNSRFEAARLVTNSNDNEKRELSSPSPLLVESENLSFDEISKNEVFNNHQEQNLLPFPKYWGQENTLSPGAKLFWIFFIAFAICICIGAIAAAFDAIDRLM
ncbi:hypothetical protein LPB140_11890 [Sphingorhabdus lutea]|uniref:HTH luxR-type domain-containing protein n=2 Tax=Sphingorhabdus lutea TaxID=1913578 RepID=A0A1L3JDZ4_9SPHN|nr:hypothetical protein LPB140_11890 [Sphingorhabdus lutea]